jgi:AbrB family looped-hinge helix DNA binding protein
MTALPQSGIAAILLPIMKTHFVAVQARGTIALPADLRRRMHLDEPGAQVQIIEHQDGHIELQPVLPIPADQAWFWTERWQAMEREADEDIAAGRVTTFENVDEFIAHLREVAGD